MRSARPERLLRRSGIFALFVEGALWSAIRFLSFVYVLAQEAELGPQHQTPGWVRLRLVLVTIAVAAVLFKAGASVRNGPGRFGRPAQVLALAGNVVVLVLAMEAASRFSGAEAEVVALAVLALSCASLGALVLDLRSAWRREDAVNPGRT